MRLIRNPIPWPNGAKCACCLTFDMDADSLIHVEYPNDGHRRVSAISMLRYGPTVAVPRIVETYRRLGIRQTFFVPAWCIEQYPKLDFGGFRDRLPSGVGPERAPITVLSARPRARTRCLRRWTARPPRA